MEDELRNLIVVWVSVVASLCYCHSVCASVPKGTLRLLSLLPVLSLFSALPLLLSAVLSAGITSFFLTWLSNFNLLLFAFDLGPLAGSHPLPLFLLLACLPLNVSSDRPRPSPKLPLNYPAKAFLCAAVAAACDYRASWHPKLLLLVYCLLVYLMVEVLFGLTNAAARALLGLDLQPPSDEPYLSTSLQDFWGRRWNLMASNALRHIVYKPLRALLGGARWAHAAAVLAAFVVSGLMHELMYYYVVRVAPTWEVTCFFVMHGVCVVVESDLKRRWLAAGGWQIPGALSGLLTVAFLVVTAEWLFFPQIMRNGVDVRTLQELKGPFGNKGGGSIL